MKIKIENLKWLAIATMALFMSCKKQESSLSPTPAQTNTSAGLFAASLSNPRISIYAGGPLYLKPNASDAINELKYSGFNEVIVWSLEVKSNGDLNFNNEFLVVSGGYYQSTQYPDFSAAMKNFTTGGTVNRLTIGVGSSNVGDF